MNLNLEGCDEAGYCGWCGELVGYKTVDGLRVVMQTAHMKEAHPVKNAVAHLLVQIFQKGLWVFPIRWSRIGRQQ